MDMTYALVVPILTMVLGWALARSDARAAYSRKRREIRARVLSDLLEVRSRLIVSTYVVGRLRSFLADNGASSSTIHETLSEFPDGFLWDDAIHRRYSSAVEELAAYQPLASWVLRNQAISLSALKIAAVTPDDGDKVLRDFASDMGSQIQQNAMPAIDQAIQGLSADQGRRTRQHVRQMLAAGSEPPEEVTRLADRLEKRFRRLARLASSKSDDNDS